MWDFRVAFPVLVDPAACVFAFFDGEVCVDFGVWFGNKLADFFFAFGEDGKGGSLYAASCSDVEAAVAGAETGEGAGGVQAD